MTVVYNLFAAVFVLFFMRALLDDVFTHGMPFHHFWLISWNFQHFIPTMLVWSLMFISTFVPYAIFKFWAHAPAKAVGVKSELHMLLAYMLYTSMFFYFPLKFLFSWELNCACSFIITCETEQKANVNSMRLSVAMPGSPEGRKSSDDPGVTCLRRSACITLSIIDQINAPK
ncbi:unnamed protein product [Heligmosomoides polygyrus]|uniref:Very-long-chain 3-oxoacyl-CoA synthase n=1 Tax=Heligmosomoides polygyrus TaxID=6339 RepID=A0A183GP76_HELPZ|nr:unnamed protein product [Heligmosomoides polygyrus]